MEKPIYYLLEEFRNKFYPWHTQYRAKSILFLLRKALSEAEYNELNTAYSHFKSGEGSDECNEVISKLKAKYS